MKRVRFYNVLGLLCNIAILTLFSLSCVAIMKHMDTAELSYNYFARYDVLASIISVVAALLMIIANIVSIKRGKTSIPRLFSFLLFFAAAFSAIAFISNICLPKYITSFEQLFSTKGGVLYFAFLIPVVVIVEFLFISIDKQIKFPAVFFPFSGTLIYVLTILIFTVVTKNNISGYRMFDVITELATGDELRKNIIILVLFVICSFGLSVVMWIVNLINHAIIFGVSVKEVEQHIEKKKSVEPKTTQVKNYFKNAIKFDYDENNDTVYHISYHNRKLKTWKVKTEEAGRALKVFKTQKEAIEYAKFMVAKKGGSIRIHSMIGRIRKDW